MAAGVGAAARAEPIVAVGDSADGSLVAVALTGDAHSSGGVAVSGTGWAYGDSSGGATASGTGRGNGPGNNFSGEFYLLNTGVLDGPVNAEQAQVPLTDNVTPTDIEAKLADAAALAPLVAKNLALGLTPLPDGSAPNSSSPDAAIDDNPLPRVDGPPVRGQIYQQMFSQEEKTWCAPASVKMFLHSAGTGEFSESDLAKRLKTVTSGENAGTPNENLPPVINNIRTQGDRIILHAIDSANTLMTYVTLDINQYRHDVILSVNPSQLGYWSGKGSAHDLVTHGYDHRGGGKLDLMDPFDYSRWGITYDQWEGPNPGGSHVVSLAEVYKAVNAYRDEIIW